MNPNQPNSAVVYPISNQLSFAWAKSMGLKGWNLFVADNNFIDAQQKAVQLQYEDAKAKALEWEKDSLITFCDGFDKTALNNIVWVIEDIKEIATVFTFFQNFNAFNFNLLIISNLENTSQNISEYNELLAQFDHLPISLNYTFVLIDKSTENLNNSIKEIYFHLVKRWDESKNRKLFIIKDKEINCIND